MLNTVISCRTFILDESYEKDTLRKWRGLPVEMLEGICSRVYSSNMTVVQVAQKITGIFLCEEQNNCQAQLSTTDTAYDEK